MFNNSARLINLAGFVICAAAMAYALYVQHVQFLEPCPLCILQRVAMIALGLVFLAAAIHNRAGRIYAGLIAVAAGAGIAVAARHVWIQYLPPEDVPACGPGFYFLLEGSGLTAALSDAFKGSGECADIDWTFLGLSMPTCVLLLFVGLAAVGIWRNWTAARPV